MRIPRAITAITIAATGLAVCAGVGLSAAAANAAPAKPVTHTVHAAARPLTDGASGWQGFATYTVPTGTNVLYYHYPCPSNHVIAVSGSYHELVNPLTPAIDVTSDFMVSGSPEQFGFVFTWPSPGSPAGEQLQFNVYCKGS